MDLYLYFLGVRDLTLGARMIEVVIESEVLMPPLVLKGLDRWSCPLLQFVST